MKKDINRFYILKPKGTTNYVKNPSFEVATNSDWQPYWDQIATFEDQELTPNPTGFDSTTGANIDVTADAAKNGNFGFEIDIQSTADRYGNLADPDDEDAMTIEFWFNDNTLVMGANEGFRLFTLQDAGGGPIGRAIDFQCQDLAGVRNFRMTVFNDAGGQTNDDIAMPSGWNKVRVEWRASSAPGADDGLAKFYLNGTLQAERTGLDNDLYAVTDIRIGAHLGVDAGTSGIIYYDDIKWASSVNLVDMGSLGTVTRVQARHGSKSLEVNTDGNLVGEGVYYRVSSLAGLDRLVIASAYVRGEGAIRIRIYNGTSGRQFASKSMVLSSKRWKRIQVFGRSADTDDLRIYIETVDTAQGVTFYVDAVQLEPADANDEATTYCDGDQEGCSWNAVHHASISVRAEESYAGGEWFPLFNENEDVYTTMIGGMGLPPTSLNRQALSITPGSVYDNTKVEERPFSLLITAIQNIRGRRNQKARQLDHLHKLRNTILEIIKPDFAANTPPLTIRYSNGERDLFMQARYDTGLEFDGDLRNIWSNAMAIRFIAFDPFWYEDTQEVHILDTEDVFEASRTAIRKNGKWEALAGFGNPSVLALTTAPDGTVYVGGTFTTDSEGNQVRRLAKLSDDYSTVIELATGLDDDVNVIVAHPNGKIYIGGDFANDNDGNAYSQIVEYDPATDSFSALGSGVTSATTGVEDLFIDSNGDLYAVGDFDAMDAVPNTFQIARWDMNGSWHSLGSYFTGNGSIKAVAMDSDYIYTGGNFSTPAVGIARMDRSTNVWEEWAGGLDGVASKSANVILINPLDGRIYVGGTFNEAGGATANSIAIWNGSAFSPLGDGVQLTRDGVTGDVNGMVIDKDGALHVIGSFDQAGRVKTVGSYAVWNGTSWANVDFRAFSAAGTLTLFGIAILDSGDIIVTGAFIVIAGIEVSGSGLTVVDNIGTATVSPRVAFSGNGRIVWLSNHTTGEKSYMDYTLGDGEVLMLDFRTGEITAQSNYFGNVTNAILPNSDNLSLLPNQDNRIFAFVVEEVDPVVQLLYVPKHWSFDAVVDGG